MKILVLNCGSSSVKYKLIDTDNDTTMAEGGVEKISVMGSMHEVGFFEGSINENTPTNPESLYGISKNTLRDLVRLICKEMNISYQWMRGFYIVGNTTDGSSVFSKIIQQANAGKTEFPFP